MDNARKNLLRDTAFPGDWYCNHCYWVFAPKLYNAKTSTYVCARCGSSNTERA